MGQKRMPGLYKRKDAWHIDKKVFGRRICESTGTSDLEEAQTYLARRLEETRQAEIYGVRPKRLFKEAAIKFLKENQHKCSLPDDAGHLNRLDPFIGNLSLEAVHMGSLQPFIEARREEVSMRTVNHGLVVVRRILNLASSEWMDEHGKTWLEHAPKIKLLPEPDLRKPYPLSWEEQHRLFNELPPHLKNMALFAVNTGCRDMEICRLRWDWETKLPEMPGIMVFIVPARFVKNGQDRLIVCNDIARSVVEAQRGIHPDHVFVYKGKAIHHMLHSAWRKARKRANLAVRVHDLKHTFGRRLRAAGVGFEDRQDLLGHRSGRITTHYSSPELQNLYQAANKVCGERPSGVVLSFVQHAHQRRVKGGLGQEASHKNVPQLSSVPLGPANLPQGVLGGIG